MDIWCGEYTAKVYHLYSPHFRLLTITIMCENNVVVALSSTYIMHCCCGNKFNSVHINILPELF